MRRHSPAPLSLALAGLALMLVACGGQNVQYEGPSAAAASEFRGQVGPWLDRLHDADFADLDRDYVYCLGIDDPVPLATAVPDESGHSRARLSCAEAAAKIAARLEEYRALVEELEGFQTPADEDDIRTAHAELVDIYTQRLRLYEEIVAARDAGNDAELARLRERNVEVVEIELTGPALVASISGPG